MNDRWAVVHGDEILMGLLMNLRSPFYATRSRHWALRTLVYNETHMTTSLPALELLEKTHAFPCLYLFKVIGKADDGFLARVIAVVREELLVEVDPAYRVREAVGGRHLSVTLEPVVQSAQQVLAIYRRLGVLDGLVMML